MLRMEIQWVSSSVTLSKQRACRSDSGVEVKVRYCQRLQLQWKSCVGLVARLRDVELEIKEPRAFSEETSVQSEVGADGKKAGVMRLEGNGDQQLPAPFGASGLR